MPARSDGGSRLSDIQPEPEPEAGGDPAPAVEGAATATLDFELLPDDLARLLRTPAFLSRRDGRARTSHAGIVWHDTADGALAADGLTLGHVAGMLPGRPWRLEHLRPHGQLDWLPAGPAPLVAEADTPDELGRPAGSVLTLGRPTGSALTLGRPTGSALTLGRPTGSALAPVAAFAGRRRVYPLDARRGVTEMVVLDGTLRGVAADRAACRVILQGQPAETADLACDLACTVRLTVPRAGLAAQAIAVARGQAPASRHCGTPAIPPGLSLDDALTFVTAHLADVILYWAVLVPGAASPEPVHQMRVGVRRLRSALGAFRRAVADEADAAPWLDTLAASLKSLSARLGAARDWDVFLAGTGAEIGQAFHQDGRVGALLAAAGRRRATVYAGLAAYFETQDWTRLEFGLALLPTRRPWRRAPARMMAARIEDHAARALDRRVKHLLSPGHSLARLGAADLHDVRKQAKRLRYAAEIFGGLFAEKPVRKYLSRLADLQEVLGAINDTATLAGLMVQLGGGTDRAFAAGVVLGFGAGRNAGDGRVDRAWTRLTRASPFWD